ncbi:alpha-L-arabinofuranosidase C-terminal domain-containing protein [uncultured Prevotella sp.]|uniref:alpha-L-arabinofuranosidase C-terminal domain-containing protein n=1 Tax=uncultured Prevotella sp. TaxID=159272 RepID=UPI0025DD223A|nr:alpha-L-arabinofuranosidase C-terminal domain-containing protein [uncultured Prevotella sp.]
MKRNNILLAALLASSLAANAQVKINVDAANPGIKVSPNLYGIFFEDINHAADGGLYAELISNRSFEDSDNAIPTWRTSASNGASITSQLVSKALLNNAQGKALQITVKTDKAATASLINEGFWGINAVQGRTYKLSLFAKGNYKGGLKARLISADGKTVYAETTVDAAIGKKWNKYTAELTANANDPKAQFELVFDGKGTVTLDVVSLFPPTFMNRPNGLRPDLAQLLYNIRPKFVRFPGGCYVEGQESPENAFHWEKTIGPIEQRPGHKNVNWRYRTSDGMGFDEYLQLAEDLNAKPLYVVNVGLWHGGMTPVDSIQPWIDECMNALEYANGPVTSKYGALRAKNGHPEPYNIEYLEIGNENNQPDPALQSDHYYERFKKFKDAVLAKYPNMHLIGNVVAWGDDNPTWDSKESVELLDEHYYRNPAWFAENFNKYDTYNRKGSEIYVGEYAVTQGFGNMGSLDAALGEAVYMMGIENNSDIVTMASYAPIFANLNDRMWAPDMIQFTSDKVFGTPSYYVQNLMANNVGTRVLKVNQTNPYKYGDVQVKPAVCRVGMGTWGTQVSFEDKGYTDANGNVLPMTLQELPTDVRGDWKVDGNIIKQTSNGESCIRLNPGEITSEGYIYKVRARKDAGNEGFLLIFNYVDDKNYCWLNLGGWNNTQHGIEQIVDGAKGQVATVSGNIETGRWYDIELKVKDDSIFASLDGKEIFASKLRANTLPGVFSTATLDENTGEVILKVANTSSENTTAEICLQGKTISNAKLIRLSAKNGKEENTIDNPTNVYPTETFVTTSTDGAVVEIPANSLNIFRLK